MDDDFFKGADIRKALEFNGIRSVMIVRNQEKLWNQIYHGEDKIDLIVTDMQYPLEAGEDIDEEAGFKLIERMEKEKIDIPVIVCSSLNYSGLTYWEAYGITSLALSIQSLRRR